MRPHLVVPTALVASLLCARPASADPFEDGALIVPMDTTYQDMGIFLAYGLVYELLRNGVPVRWAIASGKNKDDVDFTATAEDVITNDPIVAYGYRGGPWIVDAADADAAMPIVMDYLATHPSVVVHRATEPFEAEIARYLVVAPTIAMVADGNQKIARKYMQAANIPDSVLDATWPDTSPDMLDPDELAGPTDTNHTDGMLFDEDGDPVYCQLMSMHWGVKDAEQNPEVVAEVRAYLNNPVHFFAECQAVNAFENLDPHGFFLTPNGFLFADRPDQVEFHHQDSPYAQIHGPFQTVGGSEPAYSLPPGDAYKAGGVTMITEAGTPEGQGDVWMTGYLDGACPPDEPECGAFGKVSYLGGHEYSVQVPLSANPDAQGARLFLNSLFEAPCATLDGLPVLGFAQGAPSCVDSPSVEVDVTYVNTSHATALDGRVRLAVPMGAGFVAATAGGTLQGGEVVWDVGNIGPDEAGDLSATFDLAGPGDYVFSALLEYRVGMNPFSKDTADVTVSYDPGGCEGAGSGGSTSGGGTSGGGTGGDSGPATTSGSGGGTGGDTGGASASASAGDGSAGTSGGTSGETDGGTDSAGAGETVDGCGCRAEGGGAPWGWLGLPLLAFGRRRRRWVAAAALAVGGCGGRAMETGGDTGGISGTGGIGGTDGTGTTSATAGTDSGAGDSGPKFDVGNPDMGVATGCNKIDFLFVIDSSESMFDNQQNLVASFPGFVDAMRGAVQADDWHVMVVDTDAQWNGAYCENACQTLGSCPGAESFPCDPPPATELCDIVLGGGIVAPYGEGTENAPCPVPAGKRYLDATVADLEESFACIAKVGIDGADTERPMAAAATAVSPERTGPGECNEGFLREDAILVVTIITDEEDAGSPDPVQTYVDAIVAAKNGDPKAVVVLGIVPDGDLPNPVCGQEAVPAPTLASFVAGFPQSSRASVCEADYGPFLESAVGIIDQACDDFVPPG